MKRMCCNYIFLFVLISLLLVFGLQAEDHFMDYIYLNHMINVQEIPTLDIERRRTAKAGSSEKNIECSNWELVLKQAVSDNPGLKHSVWETLRPPYGAFDKIALHRVLREKRRHNKNRVILMLPGTWEAAGWSTITQSRFNTLLYLANNGYDVYTLSYRSAYLPNLEYEQFETLGIDISEILDWNFGVFREDIKACVEKIKKLSHAEKIFMSGFSRGATLMNIYASKYQTDLKGLVAFDGEIKDYGASGDPMDEATFAYVMDLVQAGMLAVPDGCNSVLCPPKGTFYQYLGESSWENFENRQLAGAVPNALNLAGAPLPSEFETLSDYIAANAFVVWGEGAFSNYNNGAIDKTALVTALSEFNRYWPTVQDFEWGQMTAWEDVPYLDYDDNEIDLPAIGFLTDLFCPYGYCIDPSIPNLTVNDDVTIYYLPDFGHMDVMYGNYSLAKVKEPLLNWLENHK